jgi:hypothetical protein
LKARRFPFPWPHHFSIFLFLALSQAIEKKEEILDLDRDQHRFRKIVFHRDAIDVWVSAMSAPDFAGHTQAMTALNKAFTLGKGFVRFAYLDCIEKICLPGRLNLRKQPYFCVFQATGKDLTERDIVNIASAYSTGFTEAANAKWLRLSEQNSRRWSTDRYCGSRRHSLGAG